LNLIFAGPCGVGKSTIAKIYSQQFNLAYLDFDELRRVHAEKTSFSLKYLNLKDVLQNIAPNLSSTKFLLDIGGDTVFRRNTNNAKRLEQIVWIKETYRSKVVVLSARKEILFFRFLSTKKRRIKEFSNVWEEWVNIAEPNWKEAGDIFIDTSFLSTQKTIQALEAQRK